MMYKSMLVAAIKVNGQTLREEGQIVRLPFGTEYSIYLQNLNLLQRAVLQIKIDGNNVSGSGLVLSEGAATSLERPVDDQRRFKFIERTAGIENFRGVRPEDGLIVINYQFEAMVPVTANYVGANLRSQRGVSYSFSEKSAGITGHGSVSDQTFASTNVGPLELQTHTIVFRLMGRVDEDRKFREVKKPFSVKMKKICGMCGRRYQSHVSYCPDDGNALDYDNTIFD